MIAGFRGLLPTAAFLACASMAPAQSGYPFQDESLHYSVNWPSGLSLGDAGLSAHHSPSGWNLEMTLSVGIPGFPIEDHFHSSTDARGCSVEFERTISHGGRKSREKTTFDYNSGVARRTTLSGGGSSSMSISSCAWDALAFLYYARRELGQGRVPPAQELYFGPAYSVRLEYGGSQVLQVSEKAETTDRVAVNLKGPASDVHFEIYFARDAARTPLSIRVPSSLGTLSMELAR